MPSSFRNRTPPESAEQPMPALAVDEPRLSLLTEGDGRVVLSGPAEPRQGSGGVSPARGRARKTEAEKLLELWAGDK